MLNIRVGERTKQVVAGLRPYGDYKPIGVPRASSDGPIIVVDNLQPAVLRGERSEGMLLAVRDGDELALLVPDRRVCDGKRVS